MPVSIIEIKASLLRLVDKFIPQEIFDFYHDEDKWKARAVVLVLLLNVLIAVFGYIAYLISDVAPDNFKQITPAALLIDLVGYCLAIILFRLSLPYSVVASMYGLTALLSLWIMLSVAEPDQIVVIYQLFFVVPMFVYVIAGFTVAVIAMILVFFLPPLYAALWAPPDMARELINWSVANSCFVYIAMYVVFYSVESYRKRATRRLNFERMEFEYAASHDNLTGLSNRASFEKRLTDALEISKYTGNKVVLALIDLDGFKPINDQYGHHAGDVVLQEISQRLLDTMRTTDTVSRLGGDEFAIIFSKLNDMETTKECLQRVVDAISPPINYENTSVSVSGSVGVAIAPDHGNEPSDLLRKADSAMYSAKTDGGRYRIYSEA